ncbi:MAG: prepilin-type N-terminal cleavage/methylation domain-containing protein [Gemmatimonadaceae bacterium]|nr:prepilin-type N-terminal cleavage/methylation domain-containing protein [Gemmatimonadaceae bacterium]
MRTARRRRGSTLVELLVVLVVLGVLLTVVNLTALDPGDATTLMDRQRERSVGDRTAVTALDSTRGAPTLRLVEPTGLSLRDSGGVSVIGGRR